MAVKTNMKKLIIALAAVACAVATQASTVKWNVNSIYGVNESGVGQTTSASRPTTGQYYVLCMLASQMSLSDAQSAIASDNIASIAAKATFQGTTTGTGAYASALYDGSWNGGDTVEIYAVILNASSVGAATYAVASTAVVSYTYADGAEDKAISLNMKTATQGTWTAITPTTSDVPEPTSGLLMLLGMAGLVLKRKRA